MKATLVELLATLAAVVSLWATPAASAQSTGAASKPPNILVIMADDVGWMNVSCYGGDIMGTRTPNIDRLAADGLRLTAFYSQPSCTAGRAAFITGQLPVDLPPISRPYTIRERRVSPPAAWPDGAQRRTAIDLRTLQWACIPRKAFGSEPRGSRIQTGIEAVQAAPER